MQVIADRLSFCYEPEPLILVADSSKEFRQRAGRLLSRLVGERMSIFELADPGSCPALAAKNRLALVLLDANMPQPGSTALAKLIWQRQPDTGIIFLFQSFGERELGAVANALPENVLYGYLSKSANDEKFCHAVRSLLEFEQSYIDPETRSFQTARNDFRFTDAEIALLEQLFLGLTDKIIAERMQIGLRTLQNQILALESKLARCQPERRFDAQGRQIFNSRVRTISLALRTGLIHAEALETMDIELNAWLAAETDSRKTAGR